MMWNLQSYPTTVLNERQKECDILGVGKTYFQGSRPPAPPRICAHAVLYNLPGYHRSIYRCGIELNFVYCPVTFGRDVVAFGRQSKSGFLFLFLPGDGSFQRSAGSAHERETGTLSTWHRDKFEQNLEIFCRKSLSICPLFNLNEWQRRKTASVKTGAISGWKRSDPSDHVRGCWHLLTLIVLVVVVFIP